MCQRRVHSQIQMPDKNEIKESTCIRRCVKSPYPEEFENLKRLIGSGDLEAIVARYPIRESPLPVVFASSLGLNRKELYDRSVRSLAEKCPVLADNLRQRMPRLTTAIEETLN